MSKFAIDFEFFTPEFGAVTLDANNSDQAEEFGIEYVKEAFPDAEDIVVTGVKEIL